MAVACENGVWRPRWSCDFIFLRHGCVLQFQYNLGTEVAKSLCTSIAIGVGIWQLFIGIQQKSSKGIELLLLRVKNLEKILTHRCNIYF